MQTDKVSKNSQIATAGNKAEDIFCSSVDVKRSLSQYFNKPISTLKKITNRKKSDCQVVFQDQRQVQVQLKSGSGGGRGHSFDRRSADKLPTNSDVITLIKAVSLKSGEDRKETPNDKDLIKSLFLGKDKTWEPQYFVHMIIKDTKVVSLYICPASLYIETILNQAYELCQPKKTCIHLSPIIYLQRKGSSNKDKRADDIQAKIKCMPDCMTQLNIVVTKIKIEIKRRVSPALIPPD
jgi:hypothetical protein